MSAWHRAGGQKFVIRIIDVDDPKNPLNNFQEIGKVECTIGKLVGSPKGRFESPLIGKGGKDGGCGARRAPPVLPACSDLASVPTSICPLSTH